VRMWRYPSLEARLLANSVLAPDCDCWWWTGALNRRTHNGYGQIKIRIDGKAITFLAHRVAYEEWIGPIPEGMTVDHTCEVSYCINPGHFQLLPNNVNCCLKNRNSTFTTNGRMMR
jgi:hypothetical protein